MANSIKAEQRGLIRNESFEEFLKEKPPEFTFKFGKGVSAEEIFEGLGLDFVQDALEGLDDIITAVSLFIDLVEDIAQIVALALGVAVDAFQALALLIRQTLEAVIDLFTGVSFNPLFHFPQTYKTRRTPSEVLYDVGMAYLDKNDGNRPITLGENFGAALVAVFSAPNLEHLMNLFDQLTKQFKGIVSFDDGDTFQSRWNRVDDTYPRDKYLPSGTSGMAPDFSKGVALTDYLFFRDLINSLGSLVNQVEKGKVALDKIEEIIALAKRRIAQINNLADRILTIINSLASLLALGEANVIFLCSGVGKAEDFSKAIINAPLHPNYPKSSFIEDIKGQNKNSGLPNLLDRELGEKGLFSGALLLHFQTPSVSSETEEVRKLLRILNLMFSPEETREAFDKSGDRLKKTGRSFSKQVVGGP